MAEIAPSRTSITEERASRPHRRLHASSFRSKGQWSGKEHQQQPQHHHTLRHNAKDTLQSAAELKPIDHLLRREKKTAEPNAKDSGTSQYADSSRSALPEIPEKKKATKEDVARARRDNARREEELRANLKSVEEIGMSSTRQLDDTYYTILEKASILRSTVAGLQHLAEESKRMHTSFEHDTNKLERDTKQNLNAFGNFDGQERTIHDLIRKLKDSRSNTDHLNERLESARLRVEAYEKRDNEMQVRRRTRWRIVWATFAGVIALIIALILAKHRRRVGDAVGQQLGRIGDLVEDVAAPVQARLRAPTDDPFLKNLFDDL